MRIKLDAVSAVDWEDAEAVEEQERPLRDAGFADIGTYVIPAIDVRMLALRKDDEDVYAAIYEHPQAGVWTDLVTRYQDGSTLTYANGKEHGMDRPENKPAQFFIGCDSGELYRRLLEERPDKPRKKIEPSNFTEYFEQAWAEEMDWRMARGGPTEAEIRRIAERDGNECPPEMVEQIRERWTESFNDFLDEQLREAYLKSSGVSAAKWEDMRERVVFVHDRLSADRVVDLYDDALDWEDDDAETSTEEARRIAESRPPRDAFAEANALLARARRYEKIGALEGPVVADVYLLPEFDEDD